MSFYEQFPENRAKSGIGCALYLKNASGKFSILLPLETVPVASGNPGSIDIDVTTSPYIGKIEGKKTLDEKESEFFLHRDSIRRLKKLEGKVVELLVVNPDFSGYRYDGTVTAVQNDATSGDPLKGNLKIIPSADHGFIDNCYDLLQPTAKFSSSIPATLLINKAETYELIVETNPNEATVSCVSDAVGVVTTAFATGKLTITSVAKGSAVISLVVSSEGHANWETTIHVVVED